MYDTSAQYLTQGVQKGYFLNDKLEVDSTIDLSGQKYFLVKYGFAEGPGQRRAKGLVVMDSNYKDLLPPFPYKHFMARENKAVGEKEIKEEYLNHFRTLVGNMNGEFGRYLNKCRYKGWLKE